MDGASHNLLLLLGAIAFVWLALAFFAACLSVGAVYLAWRNREPVVVRLAAALSAVLYAAPLCLAVLVGWVLVRGA